MLLNWDLRVRTPPQHEALSEIEMFSMLMILKRGGLQAQVLKLTPMELTLVSLMARWPSEFRPKILISSRTLRGASSHSGTHTLLLLGRRDLSKVTRAKVPMWTTLPGMFLWEIVRRRSTMVDG